MDLSLHVRILSPQKSNVTAYVFNLLGLTAANISILLVVSFQLSGHLFDSFNDKAPRLD
jgi:hypothetical protein